MAFMKNTLKAATENLLSKIFPPTFGRLENFEIASPDPISEGIITMRAYDVRMTGIEKYERGIL